MFKLFQNNTSKLRFWQWTRQGVWKSMGVGEWFWKWLKEDLTPLPLDGADEFEGSRQTYLQRPHWKVV